jgi:imidazolonepropionase-like amidohydrolase
MKFAHMYRWCVRSACLFLLAAGMSRQVTGQDTTESGSFRLHKFEQAIGEEKYTIQHSTNEIAVTSLFEFTDRGTKVALTSKLNASASLVPLSFSAIGDTARGFSIDASAETTGDKVRFRLGKDTKEVPRPTNFFFISGYSPTIVQSMLIRYWKAAGRPAKLQTFPAGELTIEDRGTDTFSINEQPTKLQRYSISGLIWGRETLWMRDNQLVALVSIDAEFDHFEALAPEYETNLGDFVRIAGADGMAALAAISKQFRTAPSEGVTALSGATLVDATGAPAVADSVVLVGDQKIIAAGPRAKVAIPKGAKVVDLRGKTIVPGLWDMHAHFEQVEWGPIYLAAGVTSVRDVGNEFEFITSVRDAIRDGRGIGPRLLLAGVVDGSGPYSLSMQLVDTPEQARQWVQKYHDAGFSQMKIYSSMKKENVEAVSAEAHKLGMTVTGHIPQGMNAYDGVNAGMDQINHITYLFEILDPEFPRLRQEGKLDALLENAKQFDGNSPEAQKAIAFLQQHHTVVDPTVALYEVFMRTAKTPLVQFEPGIAKVAPQMAVALNSMGANPNQAELREAIFLAYVKALAALHRAGIPIVVGTDQAVPGHSVHRSMELFVNAGFTPMEALQAATLVPARAMRVDKDSGTIEPGKRADLVILAANPLENISNIRKTEKVMANGVLYECGPLWKSAGFLP